MSSISEVDIPIKDGNFLNPVLFLKVSSSYRNVVKDTEAIDGISGSRVVPWRPNDCEPIFPLMIDDFINS